MTSTSDNGAQILNWMNGNNTPHLLSDIDADAGESLSTITEGGAMAKSVEARVYHVGPGGASVSGQLQLHQDTPVAQCAISGTLLLS